MTPRYKIIIFSLACSGFCELPLGCFNFRRSSGAFMNPNFCLHHVHSSASQIMGPERSFPCWQTITVHYFTLIFHNPMFCVKMWFQCILVIRFIRTIFFRTTEQLSIVLWLDVKSQISFCFLHKAALVTRIQNSFMDALNVSFHVFSCSLSALTVVAVWSLTEKH